MNSQPVVKQVSYNVFDVFFGDFGWENWSRVRVDKRLNRVFILKGKQLPNRIYKEVSSTLLFPKH